MRQFQDSSLLLHDGTGLAARIKHDGYALIRSVIPKNIIENLQLKLSSHLLDAGWLDSSYPPEACIANPNCVSIDPEPSYLKVIEGFNCLYEFNALGHHPSLIKIFERMLNDRILVHPRPIPRNIFPNLNEFTTPSHQDFPNIQGTKEVYTVWIPLIDCPEEVGGLQLAEGSHNGGVYDFGIANGSGGIEILERFEGQWVGGSMKVGDVLIFHSMTVHKGVPNKSRHLRMSIDCRYQRVSDAFNPDNAISPLGLPKTWDKVYESWPENPEVETLKYYWKHMELSFKPFDTQWFEKRDAMAIELAERGDYRAYSVLLRIIARDIDRDKCKKAQELIECLRQVDHP